jgi:hypothetical protein
VSDSCGSIFGDQARLVRVRLAGDLVEHARIPVPAQRPSVALAPAGCAGCSGVLRWRDAAGSGRSRRRPGRSCEAVGVRAHEVEDALDAGAFPARGDVDQHQRPRSGPAALALAEQQPEQAAHRGADQDSAAPGERARAAEIVDELLDS